MSTLALVSNAWLDSSTEKIRSKPVPWEGYQRANLVTSEELALIKKVDRQTQAKVQSILVTDGPTYATLYLKLLKKLVRVDTMQKFDIIPLLMIIAQSVVKEKVQRVIVATYRNLVAKAPSQNLPAMLVAKLLPYVKNLSTRKWSDEEIVEDIEFLKEELTKNFESLTTYDEYTSELASGHLSWTPVHDSEAFWKENATKLNDKDYEQLKVLVKLLKESTDPVVLAVAAHDIGQYTKYYERGKKTLSDLGAKTRVMELMSHENPDVRYQALLTTQRLVSQAWVG
ncbi:H(+)-transporting V1 sector ATPase subunit H [Tulasnella sp. 408]|nr:H(+)-transporting V1 sector ATPase subunit H [Tulasnella sp. 408]